MYQKFKINKNFNKKTAELIIKKWMIEDNKVFHLIGCTKKNNIRDFYEKIGNTIGKYHMLAEDVKLGDRSSQKANKIWMDVRYDSNIDDWWENAYLDEEMDLISDNGIYDENLNFFIEYAGEFHDINEFLSARL